MDETIIKAIASYGAVGILLCYFIYQDIQLRKSQKRKDAVEDKRNASREEDCVKRIRESELARTIELKEYLFKHLEAQQRSNILHSQSNKIHEEVIKILRHYKDETTTFLAKDKSDKGRDL